MSIYTPIYPPEQPINGISQGAFPFKVSQEFTKEYIQTAPLVSAFGGKEYTRPIYIHTIKPGEGVQFRVPFLDALDYTNPVLNFNQVSSASQTQSVSVCPVDINSYSFPLKLVGTEIVPFATPLDMPSQVRPQLMELVSRSLCKMILDGATYDPLNRQKQYTPYQDLETKKPSFDRVAFAGYTFERDQYRTVAGIKEALNYMDQGTTYDKNGLSTEFLLKLRRMAIDGGVQEGSVKVNNTIETRIRPAFVRTKAGFPDNKWLFLCSPAAVESLLKDPVYIQTTSGRGTVVSEEQPQAVSGASYRGTYEGIMIYEVDELSNYDVTSENNGTLAAWCMLVGGGAWSLGWAKNPWIAFKNDPINMVQEFTTHEMRGHRSLILPSRQFKATGIGSPEVEQGIIHAFVRIQ